MNGFLIGHALTGEVILSVPLVEGFGIAGLMAEADSKTAGMSLAAFVSTLLHKAGAVAASPPPEESSTVQLYIRRADSIRRSVRKDFKKKDTSGEGTKTKDGVSPSTSSTDHPASASILPLNLPTVPWADLSPSVRRLLCLLVNTPLTVVCNSNDLANPRARSQQGATEQQRRATVLATETASLSMLLSFLPCYTQHNASPIVRFQHGDGHPGTCGDACSYASSNPRNGTSGRGQGGATQLALGGTVLDIYQHPLLPLFCVCVSPGAMAGRPQDEVDDLASTATQGADEEEPPEWLAASRMFSEVTAERRSEEDSGGGINPLPRLLGLPSWSIPSRIGSTLIAAFSSHYCNELLMSLAPRDTLSTEDSSELARAVNTLLGDQYRSNNNISLHSSGSSGAFKGAKKTVMPYVRAAYGAAAVHAMTADAKGALRAAMWLLSRFNSGSHLSQLRLFPSTMVVSLGAVPVCLLNIINSDKHDPASLLVSLATTASRRWVELEARRMRLSLTACRQPGARSAAMASCMQIDRSEWLPAAGSGIGAEPRTGSKNFFNAPVHYPMATHQVLAVPHAFMMRCVQQAAVGLGGPGERAPFGNDEDTAVCFSLRLNIASMPTSEGGIQDGADPAHSINVATTVASQARRGLCAAAEGWHGWLQSIVENNIVLHRD